MNLYTLLQGAGYALFQEDVFKHFLPWAIAGLGINLVISGVISLVSESVFGTKSLVTEVVTGTSIFTSSVIKSWQIGLFFWIFAVLFSCFLRHPYEEYLLS